MSTAKKITGWMKDAGMLAAGATFLGGKKLWQGVKGGATYAYEHRALAKEAAWGTLHGTVEATRDVHAVALRNREKQQLLSLIAMQYASYAYLHRQIQAHLERAPRDRVSALEYVAIGGHTLADYLAIGAVPDDVQEGQLGNDYY